MLPFGEGRREDERQPHLATAVAVRAEHGAPGEGARLVGEVRLRLTGRELRRVDLAVRVEQRCGAWLEQLDGDLVGEGLRHAVLQHDVHARALAATHAHGGGEGDELGRREEAAA